MDDAAPSALALLGLLTVPVVLGPKSIQLRAPQRGHEVPQETSETAGLRRPATIVDRSRAPRP